MKFEVKAVDSIEPEEGSCVVATTEYDVDFSVPFLHLRFGDVGRHHPDFIKEVHVERLRDFLPVIEKSEKVYVGCDMGRRRGPATARAVAEKLGYNREAERIKGVYKFLNPDVYNFIKQKL